MTTDTLDTTTQDTAEALPYLPCELLTERLRLRPLTKDDLDDLHPSYQKRKDVARYLQWEVHDHDEPTKNLEKRLAMSRLANDGDGLIYAVERLATELWKSFIREDDQDAYAIPMRIAVLGRTVDGRGPRYLLGVAIFVAVVVMAFVAAQLQPADGGPPHLVGHEVAEPLHPPGA